MIDSPYAETTNAVSLRQLRLFEAIGEFNSVRRASEACNLSQPAVTQSLSKLEREIGTVLVDRTASGSFLNDDGKIFHARTVRFFQHAAKAIVDIDAAPSTQAARLVLNRLTRAQIRGLVAVLDHGTIPQAAEALDITVASLQRSARDLEGNLGIPLFYRTAMGILVNPQGMEFGRRIKIAMQEIELGLEEIADAHGLSQRQIVIGAKPLGGSVLLAGVLDAFVEAYPRAALRIMSENASELTESLRCGDVDFVVGLLPETQSDELLYESFARTPYSIVVRKGHPLARKGKATLDDLLKYDWIVGTAGSNRKAFFERIFNGSELPKSRLTTCSPSVIRHMLERSDRLTLMTSYELHHEENLRAVSYEQFLGSPSIGVITRKNWQPTRLHAAFIELLRHHVMEPGTVQSFRQAS